MRYEERKRTRPRGNQVSRPADAEIRREDWLIRLLDPKTVDTAHTDINAIGIPSWLRDEHPLDPGLQAGSPIRCWDDSVSDLACSLIDLYRFAFLEARAEEKAWEDLRRYGFPPDSLG